MADVQYVPMGFRQTSDICLLSSYSFVLGYYKKLNEGAQADVNVHDVCRQYFSYFMSLIDMRADLQSVKEFLDLEYHVLPNPHQSPKNSCIFEYFIFRVLHHYCQVYGNDIRGYEHIRVFDEYLRNNNNNIHPQNFIINRVNTQRNIIHQEIRDYLDSGTHHLAMILYATGSGGHSVVVFKNDADGLYYFRDSNSLDITKTASSVNIDFSDQLNISEYILFSDR